MKKQIVFSFSLSQKFYPPPPIKTPPFKFSKNVVKNNFFISKTKASPSTFLIGNKQILNYCLGCKKTNKQININKQTSPILSLFLFFSQRCHHFFLFFFYAFFQYTKKLPYLSLSERWRKNVFKLVETCQNVSKCVETCRKLLFYLGPYLLVENHFCIIIPKHFLLFENKKQNTASVYTSYIRKWNVQKNEENFFIIIIILSHILDFCPSNLLWL